MPVLNINEHEIVTLLSALRTEIKDWDGRIQGSAPRKVEWIKRNIDECLALRERLQGAACSTTEDGPEPLAVTEITEAEAFKRAVDVSWGIPRRRIEVDQDQVSPGTWTTLPDEFDADAWPFDVTDPEEKVVVAADTQTDGTMIGFFAHPTETDRIVSNGIWALITKNFGNTSDREIQLAEKVLSSDPSILSAIRSSVDGLQKAYSLGHIDANDTLFSCFDRSEYDRIEISVNGAWRNRYRVRKSESDKFLKDLAKVFIDRD